MHHIVEQFSKIIAPSTPVICIARIDNKDAILSTLSNPEDVLIVLENIIDSLKSKDFSVLKDTSTLQ